MTTPLEQRYKYNNNLIVYFYGGNEITNDQRIYIERCLRLLTRMIHYSVVYPFGTSMIININIILRDIVLEWLLV